MAYGKITSNHFAKLKSFQIQIEKQITAIQKIQNLTKIQINLKPIFYQIQSFQHLLILRMNPLNPKKDIAMSLASNAYMNSTSRYVPTSNSSNKSEEISQKVKQKSLSNFGYSRTNKQQPQIKDQSSEKRLTGSNIKSSGIQISKLSDLGSSSLFQGLDGLVKKPIQHSDRNNNKNDSEKGSQSKLNNQSSGNTKSSLHFQRRQRNKLMQSSSTYSNTKEAVSQIKQSPQKPVQVIQKPANKEPLIIRKPNQKIVQQKQIPKQPQNTNYYNKRIQRTPQPATQAKQESSSTQKTSGYVYKPPKKFGEQSQSQIETKADTSVIKTTAINTSASKTSQITNKTIQKPSLYVNRLTLARSQQPFPQGQLNLQINTDVKLFNIDVKGSQSKRSNVSSVDKNNKVSQQKTVNNKNASQQVQKNQNNGKQKPILNQNNTNSYNRSNQSKPYTNQVSTNNNTNNKIPSNQTSIKPPITTVNNNQNPYYKPAINPPVKQQQKPQTKDTNTNSGYVYRPRNINVASNQQSNQPIKQQTQVEQVKKTTYPPYKRQVKNNQQQVLPQSTQKQTKQQNKPKSNLIYYPQKKIQPINIQSNSTTKQQSNKPIVSKPLYGNTTVIKNQSKTQQINAQNKPFSRTLNLKQDNLGKKTIEVQKPVTINLNNQPNDSKNSVIITPSKSPQMQNKPLSRTNPNNIISNNSTTLTQNNKFPTQASTLNNSNTNTLSTNLPKVNSPKSQQKNQLNRVVSPPVIKPAATGYVYQPPNRRNTVTSNNQSSLQNSNITTANKSRDNSPINQPIKNKFNQTKTLQKPVEQKKQQTILQSPKYRKQIQHNKVLSNSSKTPTINNAKSVMQNVVEQKQQIKPPVEVENKSSYYSRPTNNKVNNPATFNQVQNQSTNNNANQLSYSPNTKNTNIIKANNPPTNPIKPQVKSNTSLVKNNQTQIAKQNQQAANKALAIPSAAYSIVDMILKRKKKINLKYAFQNLNKNKKEMEKKQKLYGLFVKKLDYLSKNYEKYIKQASLLSIKKGSLSNLMNQNKQDSLNKSRMAKQKNNLSLEDKQYEKLSTNAKSLLCFSLNTIVNSKLRLVLNQKLNQPYQNSKRKIQEASILHSLNNLFKKKINQKSTQFFKSLKFYYHVVPKQNDQNICELFQTKNKKLTKQEIAKFFQNIYTNGSFNQSNSRIISQSNSRILGAQKTPQRVSTNPMKGSTLKNNPSSSNLLQSSVPKKQSQKVITLRNRIEAIQKQISQLQKDQVKKQKEITTKKLQIKRQMTSLKRQNDIKKKQNQKLKDQLKKYELFNNNNVNDKRSQFNKNTKNVVNKAEVNNNQIFSSSSTTYLPILSTIYVDFLLKNQSQNLQQSQSIDTFIQKYTQQSIELNQIITSILPNDQDRKPSAHSSSNRLQQSIQDRIIMQRNLQLKRQINFYETNFIDHPTQLIDQNLIKIQEQVHTIKSLIRNYIKQRYLWEWIKKSINQVGQ